MTFNTKIVKRERCAQGSPGLQTYAANTNRQQAFIVTIKSIQTSSGTIAPIERQLPPTRLEAGGVAALGCSEINRGDGVFLHMNYEVVGEQLVRGLKADA